MKDYTRIIKTVLCASVKGREQQLKVALKSIYDQVDEIHLVLNWYMEVPGWIQNLTKIYTYLNPTNQNAHDAIWFRVIGLEAIDNLANDHELKIDNYQSRYYFAIDDDLLYPANYVAEMIKCIERHERNAVITAHGANIVRPVKDYFECRRTYGFSDRLERDIFVDMSGVGVSAWHSSTIKPTPNDFPVPFCRDLWFAILAKKNDVPLVSLRRPSKWILPLQTEGETVFELTHSNEKLKALKNRILKEQLLPLLFCNYTHRGFDKYVLMTDYGFDRRLVDNSLSTLRKAELENDKPCNKIVFTNELQKYGEDVLTQFVTDGEKSIGICGSRILTQYRFMKSLPNGSKIITADCDMHYVRNPFTAFDIGIFNTFTNSEWDIAVTTRAQEYQYPINSGIVFFKISDRVRNLLDYLMAEIYDRTWFELMQYQRKFGHQGNDWYIDQDIWCCCWLYKKLIKDRFDVTIIDAGPKYNYCPHSDGSETENGKRIAMEALQDKSISVLHLKSRLKELLFDGDLK